MQDKITLAIDALASAAFVEGGVSPENTQAARDLTEQRKRELLAAIGAPCLHQIQEPSSAEQAAQNPDDAAVDAMAALMKVKLAKQRDKGYSGWDTDCTRERLSELLRGHVDKGDPVDVANFCAFLSARGEGIAPQAAPAAVAVPDFENWIKREYPWLGPIGDGVHIAREAWSAALAATPAAAAPVVLPEPDAAISEIMELVEKASVQRASMAVLIYTEQPKEFSDKAAAQERDTVKLIKTKLRALLAGASAPAAHSRDAVTPNGDKWKLVDGDMREAGDGLITYHAAAYSEGLADASQAQADAREAQLLAFAVSEIRRDEMEHEPVLYVSKGQLGNFRDPDGPDSTAHGRYLPARVTPSGKFTTPLFAAPQALADARDADVLEWLLPNLHPANFGLEFDNDKLDENWNAEFKRAILAAADESTAIAAQAAQQGGDKQ
ncbi:hypothetical protein QYQ99_17595 [Comamonas testosteroni]|uniref:hypothetical protein n=1 Tax=Comamonas testosteroni TaxID=285 RepID=UPI00265DACE7|nr:hypothetical protein [Comamonas testosteroni]WKL14221.1 hypothetical protein QYQ99_17595 [Comamonas testosteroni]